MIAPKESAKSGFFEGVLYTFYMQRTLCVLFYSNAVTVFLMLPVSSYRIVSSSPSL